MGTNYYWIVDICPTCNRGSEEVHIGKYSGGWRFSFQSYDDIKSWRQWKEHLKNQSIKNEYGEIISFDIFCNIVENSRGSIHAKEYPNSTYWIDEDGYSFSSKDFW